MIALTTAEGGRGTARSWEPEQPPVLGIVTHARDLYSFVSVRRTWQQTIDLLSREFPTRVYTADSFEIDCESAGYQDFARSADLLVLLAPYFRIRREVKETPAIVYGLGSLQKGGYWLYRNQDSFRPYDTLVLNCSSCLRIYHKITGHSALQPAILPPPIDPNVFYPRGDKARARQRYGLPLDAILLIFAGRISLQKNCHVLLNVLHAIRKRHNVHLVLLGFYDNFYIPEFSQQSPPDCRLAMQTIVERHGLSRHVTVIDHQDDPATVAEIMSICDVGINLSTLINENFGLAPVEMQLCGLPVICSHWGGMQDTVVHGRTGFHVDTILSRRGPRLNHEQAVHYLEQLARDRQLRQHLGANARRNAETYTMPHLAVALRSLVYQTLQRAETVDPGARFVFHPAFESFYQAAAECDGEPGELSWAHLRPALDFEAYRLVVSECATCEAEEILWTQESVVSKAFDWQMQNAAQWNSLDPRWSPSFELRGLALTKDELALLWQIEQGIRDIRQLSQAPTWPVVRRILNSLTQKGLILPATSLVEQRLGQDLAGTSRKASRNSQFSRRQHIVLDRNCHSMIE